MNNLFLVNLITLFSGFAPIMGLLISQVEIKMKRVVLAVEIALLDLAAFLFFGFSWSYPGVANPVLHARMLAFYPLMMAVMLPLFAWRFGISRGLALTLMLGFLLTELQEIVGFVKMWMGLFDNSLAQRMYWNPVYTPMNHAYSVVVGFLALRVSRFKRGWGPQGLVLFSFGVLLEALIYDQLTYTVYDAWDAARRLLWLPIILAIFMLGGSGRGEQ